MCVVCDQRFNQVENVNSSLQSSSLFVSDSEEARYKLYTDVLERFPRASAPKRIPLTFTTGWTTIQSVN